MSGAAGLERIDTARLPTISYVWLCQPTEANNSNCSDDAILSIHVSAPRERPQPLKDEPMIFRYYRCRKRMSHSQSRAACRADAGLPDSTNRSGSGMQGTVWRYPFGGVALLVAGHHAKGNIQSLTCQSTARGGYPEILLQYVKGVIH